MADRPATPRNSGDHNAPHMSPATPAEDARTVMINRIAWSAVLAGVVIALVTQLILNMIGIGVGLSTVDPAAGAGENPSATSLSIGAGIWFVLSGVIASFAGGYAAGRLAGKPKESTSGWHGLTAWALTTLVIFYLLTSTVGGLLGGAYNTVASALGGVGSTAQTALQAAAPSLGQVSDPFSAIENQIRSATGGNDPAALRDAAVAAMRAAVTGDQAQAQAARDRAAQALARAQGIPEDQARAQVQQYEQQYRQALDQARQMATQAADTATTGVSRGALLASVALILGAIAGWFGGRTGTVHPTLTDDELVSAAHQHSGGSMSRSTVDVEDNRRTTVREPVRRT